MMNKWRNKYFFIKYLIVSTYSTNQKLWIISYYKNFSIYLFWVKIYKIFFQEGIWFQMG